jgi:hypothetical protein
MLNKFCLRVVQSLDLTTCRLRPYSVTRLFWLFNSFVCFVLKHVSYFLLNIIWWTSLFKLVWWTNSWNQRMVQHQSGQVKFVHYLLCSCLSFIQHVQGSDKEWSYNKAFNVLAWLRAILYIAQMCDTWITSIVTTCILFVVVDSVCMRVLKHRCSSTPSKDLRVGSGEGTNILVIFVRSILCVWFISFFATPTHPGWIRHWMLTISVKPERPVYQSIGYSPCWRKHLFPTHM